MFDLKLSLMIGVLVVLSACATKPNIVQSPSSPTKQTKKPTIALVLGGGGARGFAHIGVIDELEKHGIRPNWVVGSSAGAIVGAVYASGKTPKQLHEFADAFDEHGLIDLAPSHQGLLEGKKLQDFINAQVGNQPADRLPIAFVAVATDQHSKTAIALKRGDTGLLVRASASIPKLFIAPRIDEFGQASKYGKPYSDGGQTALVPSAIAKSLGADIVIAVDVMADLPVWSAPSNHGKLAITRQKTGILTQLGEFSFEIPVDFEALLMKLDDGKSPTAFEIALPSQAMQWVKEPASIWQTLSSAKMSEQDKQVSDVIIRPNLANMSVVDTHQRHTAIKAGQQAAQLQIATIQRLIEQKSKH